MQNLRQPQSAAHSSSEFCQDTSLLRDTQQCLKTLTFSLTSLLWKQRPWSCIFSKLSQSWQSPIPWYLFPSSRLQTFLEASKQAAKVFKKKIQVFPRNPLWLSEGLISFLTFHGVWQVSSVFGKQAHSIVLNTKRERTRWQQLHFVIEEKHVSREACTCS